MSAHATPGDHCSHWHCDGIFCYYEAYHTLWVKSSGLRFTLRNYYVIFSSRKVLQKSTIRWNLRHLITSTKQFVQLPALLKSSVASGHYLLSAIWLPVSNVLINLSVPSTVLAPKPFPNGCVHLKKRASFCDKRSRKFLHV